jgi:hypothetical protein
MRPETYILRIYRRRRDLPQQIAGRVETPGGELCAGFSTLAELSKILELPKTHLYPPDGPDVSSAALVKVYRQEGPDDPGA